MKLIDSLEHLLLPEAEGGQLSVRFVSQQADLLRLTVRLPFRDDVVQVLSGRGAMLGALNASDIFKRAGIPCGILTQAF